VSSRLVLVTGGAGFIGSHLVEHCAERGARVRVLDDFSSGSPANLARLRGAIELERGDVRDVAQLAHAARGCDVVFHLAARASAPAALADPAAAHAVNASGVLHALLAARDAGVRRLVFASSCALYGDGDGDVQRESDPARPRSVYAIQKLCGELYCRELAPGLGVEAAVLRLFNVYGPRQDPGSEYAAVVPRFLAALERREPVGVFGDGEQSRDFVYVGDVVRALVAAADAPGVGDGAAINVGSGEALRVRELCAVLSEVYGRPVERRHAPARPGDVLHSRASIDRARERLGWKPQVPLFEGLELTASALRRSSRSRAAD
jgi:nucleoside-diphosphate-sugar epimerase